MIQCACAIPRYALGGADQPGNLYHSPTSFHHDEIAYNNALHFRLRKQPGPEPPAAEEATPSRYPHLPPQSALDAPDRRTMATARLLLTASHHQRPTHHRSILTGHAMTSSTTPTDLCSTTRTISYMDLNHFPASFSDDELLFLRDFDSQRQVITTTTSSTTRIARIITSAA
jgi:hypothetical protein